MMSKGAQWLKIDMHYQPTAFCVSQGVTNPDGCFILLHDTPSTTVRYNTSNDVLDYIQAHPKFFNRPDFPIYIALCFKSTPWNICDASNAGFLRLVNAFKARTDALIANGANLQFILDGSLTVTQPCTIDAWEPWVATWQGLPYAAFVSDNQTLGYDRLAVYDLPAVYPVYWLAEAANWGKFMGRSWPLLVWEPADEWNVAGFSSIYLNWVKNHPQQPIDQVSDYRFAINIDPIQFEVYAATATNRTWRVLLDSHATAPKIVVLPSGPYPLSTFVLYNQAGVLKYRLIGSSQLQGAINFVAEDVLPSPFTGWVTSLSAASTSIGNSILIGDSHGLPHLYQLQDSGNLKSYTVTSRMTHSNYSSYYWVNSVTPSQTSLILRVVGDGAPGASCVWRVEMLAVSFGGNEAALTLLGTDCLPGLSVYSKDSSASVAAYQHKTSYVEGVISLTIDHIVYSAYVVFQGGRLSASWPAPIGVGTNTSISLAWDNNHNAYVHEVHSDGFCFNTETRNKQASPPVCEQVATSTPNVLNYNYAPLANWRNLLLGQKNNTMLTSCSEQILHGTYDQGRSPSIAMAYVGNKFGVVEVHEGWRKGDVDISECGAPLVLADAGGAVLDSWPLPFQFL